MSRRWRQLIRAAASRFLCLAVLACWCDAQQQYEDNKQLNCYGTNGSSVLGYSCNATQRGDSCASYLTFRASSPYYQSAVTISYLLAADTSNVSAANDVPTVSPFPDGHLVLVPVTCACDGVHYQHNASYTLQFRGETYFITANNTYQGLSTCQALIAQNPRHGSRFLTGGTRLLVPLRCACPTARQAASGIKYLLTYLITWGDNVSAIADRFGADYQSVLDANQLTNASTIYPFTTLLVPLKKEPNASQLNSPPPPPAGPPLSPPAGGSGSSHTKWAFVGVGAGLGIIAIASVLLASLCCYRRRRRRPAGEKAVAETSAEYGALPEKPSLVVSGKDIRAIVESVTVYKYEELAKATGGFAEDRRVNGSSVYRGVINGDVAAIKRLKGDVSNEMNILKHVNHSNVVRLSGFCVHEGDTYMVYEYAENGALSEWLHGGGCGGTLGWKQRVHVAYDVADGLNYLHHYTNPPCVHKNLQSSNVLLDGEFRAKVSNFGLARAVAADCGEIGAQLTRHVVGTQGYLAPEYLEHGLISPQLDVFAFGVVVLELLSGKEAAFAEDGDGKKGETFLWESVEGLLDGEHVRSKLREFMDPRLRGDYPFDLAFAIAGLALRCVARDPGSRPGMTEVLVSLSAVYNSTLDWDPSDYGNSGSKVLAR